MIHRLLLLFLSVKCSDEELFNLLSTNNNVKNTSQNVTLVKKKNKHLGNYDQNVQLSSFSSVVPQKGQEINRGSCEMINGTSARKKNKVLPYELVFEFFFGFEEFNKII